MSDDDVAMAAFAHGFVGSTQAVRSSHAREWPRIRVGRVEVAVHPTTTLAHRANGDPTGVAGAVFGQPVDLESPSARSAVVLRRLLRHVERGGLDDAARYAARLGGRWAAVLGQGDAIHVLHDSHAAQSVYWADRAGRVVLASHAALCADEVGADVDEQTLGAFAKIREVRPKGTVFLPGARTPYLGVRPVIANCRLEISGAEVPKHQRYWPYAPGGEAASRSEDVYDEFEAAFDQHFALITSIGRVGQSLTAGGDSAVTLAALKERRPSGAFTFTYVNPNEVSRNAGVVEDLFGASRRAFDAGLPHRLIKWRLPAAEDPFAEAVGRMWPHLKPSLGAAYAMYRDLPRGFYELQSTVSETGTVFYRNRTEDPAHAQRLTALWAGPGAARRNEYVEAFEEYIAYAHFTKDEFHGYDYHDLFYWEHRNSRWAAEKYQLGDIGHRVLLPFNARPIIEPMLSLPYEDRIGKWLLQSYVERRGAHRMKARVANALRRIAANRGR